MNNIKILPKNTTTDVGALCLYVDISSIYNLYTPIELKEHIDMYLEVSNAGHWSINESKQNRLDLFLSNIVDNEQLYYVEQIIEIYNNHIMDNVANITLVPKSIIVEVSYDDVKFSKNFQSIFLNNPIPVYLSILDKLCSLSPNTLEYITKVLPSLKTNKLYFTLMVDATISPIILENYRLEMEYYLNWFNHKSCVIYSQDMETNLIGFTFKYNFKYFQPSIPDYTSIIEQVGRIDRSVSNITNQLILINDILTKG